MTSLIRRNVIANYVGRGWSALLSLALIPAYTRILGPEALGLIALNAMLYQVFNLMDMGFTATLTREMARRTGSGSKHDDHAVTSVESAQDARNLVRTFEVIYWPIALIIVLVVWVLAPMLAHHWLREPKALTPAAIQQAVIMMGVSLAVQWPYTLYEGALSGLQRQVLLNGIITVTATVRGVGSLVVILIYPTIQAFFLWQIFSSALTTSLVWVALWRCLPKSQARPRYDHDALRAVRCFAVSMAGITALEFGLTQMDKVVLSRSVTLQEFGYYSLAYSAAGGLYYIFMPLYAAYYPRLVGALKHDSRSELSRVFHTACRLVAIAVIPAGVTMSVFARQVMTIWTHSGVLTEHTSHIMSLLAIGFCLFGLIHIPIAMMRAEGLTRFLLIYTGITVLIALPAMVIAVHLYASVGACYVFIAINLAWMFVMVPVMHGNLLSGEFGSWITRDVALPAGVAIAAVLVARSLLDGSTNWRLQLAQVLFAGTLALGAVVSVTFPKYVVGMFGRAA